MTSILNFSLNTFYNTHNTMKTFAYLMQEISSPTGYKQQTISSSLITN
jgi:hypothetical protein